MFDKLYMTDVLRTPDAKQTSQSNTITNLSRRGFLGTSSALVIGVSLAGCSSGDEAPEIVDVPNLAPQGESPLKEVKGGDATPSLWIEIEETGNVKITVHRSEMGQQAWTSMTQIVADELEAKWDDIEVVQALGDVRYGDQNTDGSRSVRYNMYRLRLAGAAMRDMLVQAAAAHWSVEKKDCVAEQGVVSLTGSDKRLSYGQLAKAAAVYPIPAEADVPLKERSQWRYIGKEMPSRTVPKIVRGEGTFGIDVQIDNMVYAVIAHPPQVFGKVKFYDDTAALAVPGVARTFKLPEAVAPAAFQAKGGVAVIANDTWSAIKGREALNIEWDAGPNAGFNSADFKETLLSRIQEPGKVERDRGNVEAGLAEADQTVSADYYVGFQAHSSMEPPCATAKWEGDKLECWACVQDPQTTRNTLAQLLSMPLENITVHATWLGGAFGRKSKCDFVHEAALISKEIGKPVKVTWTREDDLQNDYYHAISAQHFEAGLSSDGKCDAWLHRSAFPTIGSTFTAGADMPGGFELALGASDTPFNVSNIRLEGVKAEANLRIGWLRSVSNIHHAFGVQSFAAELAHAAGKDQKDYLLELIGPDRIIDLNKDNFEYANYGADISDYPVDTARLKNVLNRASSMANWGRELPEGHGLGIAVHRSFLSYVATVIEVAVTSEGVLSIPGVWMSIDAGTVVNPKHVRAQMEGGAIFGLSHALYGEITATNGAVDQANFPDWRLLRMEEAPRAFEVDVVESNAPPAGVGEPGTPPAAPALANAIFAATGKRFRSLPIIGADGYELPLGSAEQA